MARVPLRCLQDLRLGSMVAMPQTRAAIVEGKKEINDMVLLEKSFSRLYYNTLAPGLNMGRRRSGTPAHTSGKECANCA